MTLSYLLRVRRPMRALTFALLGCIALAGAVQAVAAPRDTRTMPPPASMPLSPSATPAAPAAPAPVGTETGAVVTTPEEALVPAATGICQCLSDHNARHIVCLSTVDQCRSSCASTHYSFVPSAPSCPVTAH